MIKLTHTEAVKIAMSMYLGERCKFCLERFETLESLQDAVWAGCHEHGRIAHQRCWDEGSGDDQGRE